YSTGSVGLGAAAPLFGALADRYAATHFRSNATPDQPRRYVALVGDAELDEGNVWEAISEEIVRGPRLGNVLWMIDLTRQQLDRAHLASLLGALGGHDLRERLAAFAAADAESCRPTVLFAYTMKGWGLPFAGDPLNHSALLTEEQIVSLRERLEIPPDDDWAC